MIFVYCPSCKGFVPLERLNGALECAYCGEHEMVLETV